MKITINLHTAYPNTAREFSDGNPQFTALFIYNHIWPNIRIKKKKSHNLRAPSSRYTSTPGDDS